MDHRIPLKFHTVLAFPGLICHVEDLMGQGSNAMVYKGWYADSLNPDLRHHVLIKELFPFHPRQKIFRLPDGSLRIEPEAQELWDSHRQSFEAGNAVHLRLLADHPGLMALGANLNSYAYNGTLYSVLGCTGGRSLLSELNSHTPDLRCTVRRMLGLLNALEAFHKSGYLHLDISPDNVMLVGREDREQIFLIDYNSARSLDAEGETLFSRKPGYSPPEVETGSGDAGFASDLYAVTAVFFRCIMGRALTLSETLRPKAPDGQDSPLLMDQPQTVCAMTAKILKKGLATLPARRYQSIGQMRQAFQELLDRIDCVGVTHWSLWENGKRSVDELIRVNPSLRYLKEGKLYPIRLEREDSLSLDRYLEELLSPGGRSGLIVAQGGMGKTTLLLHTALLTGKRFSPASPAVIYIPLGGWQNGDSHYIEAQILSRLRFRPGENNFDSALHALGQLLSEPLTTRSGEVPAVLLLLDGLNEIQGDISPLVREIRELKAKSGVRILAASRNDLPELELETAVLTPLTAEDVGSCLGNQGLLIPRSPQLMQLLRTPLTLSIYIQANREGPQRELDTEEELMQGYLDALLEKEIRDLPDTTPRRWQTEAALHFLLPRIAAESRRTGRALTENQLLKLTEKCWKDLRSPGLRKRYPQWTGRSRDIRGEAQTPEEWYGILVQDLLWKRLGMLTRNSDGSFRVFHQILEGHLADRYRPLPSPRRWVLAASAIVLCLLTLRFLEYRQDMRDAIEHSATGYHASGTLYGQLRSLTELALAGDTAGFADSYSRFAPQLELPLTGEAVRQHYKTEITGRFGAEGLTTVSWSLEPFDSALALELLGFAEAQADYYARMLPMLARWMASEEMQAACPRFAELFSAVLEADADVSSQLYQQVCAVHLDRGDTRWAEYIQATTAELRLQESHRLQETAAPVPSLENLRVTLRNAKAELESAWQTLATRFPENP